jgi:hypothetical protein
MWRHRVGARGGGGGGAARRRGVPRGGLLADAAQDWNPDQAEAMCDVNLTGCVRVIGAALPDMVARGRGHVVITGSLSGFRGLPGAIGYGASKAGCMALAESMQADLRGSGIVVQLSNPGFIRTRLTAKNDFSMPFLMEPAEAADHMFRQMQGNRFSVSFPMVFSWLFRLSQFLPDWAYYRSGAGRSRGHGPSPRPFRSGGRGFPTGRGRSLRPVPRTSRRATPPAVGRGRTAGHSFPRRSPLNSPVRAGQG